MQKLITREQIAEGVARIGQQITHEFAGQTVILVGVLKGACLFLSDLARQIELDATFDFIAVRSYGTKKESAGEVQLIKDVTTPLEDKNVILVEDILDTGYTYTFLRKLLLAHKPRTLKLPPCWISLPAARWPVEADYVGFQIPDEFVVGYGLTTPSAFVTCPIFVSSHEDTQKGVEFVLDVTGSVRSRKFPFATGKQLPASLTIPYSNQRPQQTRLYGYVKKPLSSTLPLSA